MEDISLQIHKTSQFNKSRLVLEGTVLIFEEKNKVIESETQIPVELIEIYEGKKFRGSRLIIGLLFPVISIIVCVIIGAIFGLTSKDSKFNNAFGLIVGFVFLLSSIISIILAIRFFFRVSIVTLVIPADGFNIEFWKSKKDSKKINEFIKQIKQRQTMIEQPLKHALSFSIYTAKYSPFLQVLAFIFLFSLPALFAKIIYLLLLTLLPAVYFAYKGAKYLEQPREYRKAMSLYIQKKWNEAAELLENLKKINPEYVPACQLLIAIYLRIKQFDKAFNVTASLPKECNYLAQDIQADIWYFKRLYDRRISIG